MNPIRLFLEKELIKMSTERGRGKGLVTVLAFAILDGRVFRGGLSVSFVPCSGALRSIRRTSRRVFVYG